MAFLLETKDQENENIRLSDVINLTETSNFVDALKHCLILEHQKLEFLWRKLSDEWVFSVNALDVDNDGYLEIISAGEDCFVNSLKYDTGEPLWQYNARSWIRCLLSVDINNDGFFEIVFGTGEGKIIILDQHGSIIREFETNAHIRSLAAVRVAHGSEIRLAVGCENVGIKIFSSVGDLIHTYKADTDIRGLYTADIDNDGYEEILAGADNFNLYILKYNTDLLWKFETTNRIYALWAGDIDRDGNCEIVIGNDDGIVYVLSNTGVIKWLYQTTSWVRAIKVYNDGKDLLPRLLIGTGDGNLISLSGIGDLVWQTQIPDKVRSIYVDDFDKDGFMELALGTGVSTGVRAAKGHVLFYRIVGEWDGIQKIKDDIWHKLIDENGSLHETIKKLSSHPNEFVRADAFRMAVMLSKPEQLDLLRTGLQDISPISRSGTIKLVLNNIDDNIAHQGLQSLLNDSNSMVRFCVLENMISLGGPKELHFRKLFPALLRDPEIWIRREAIRSLIKYTDLDAEIVFDLIRHIPQDTNKWILHETALLVEKILQGLHGESISYLYRLSWQGCNQELFKLITDATSKDEIRKLTALFYELLRDNGESDGIVALNKLLKTIEDSGSPLGHVYFILKFIAEANNADTFTDLIINAKSINNILSGEKVDERNLFSDNQMLFRNISDKLSQYSSTSVFDEKIRILAKVLDLLETASQESSSLIEGLAVPEQILIRKTFPKWREIIRSEMQNVAGKPSLIVNLADNRIPYESPLTLSVEIMNQGNGAAYDIHVAMGNDVSYTIVGIRDIHIKFVSVKDTVRCSLRLFQIKLTTFYYL